MKKKSFLFLTGLLAFSVLFEIGEGTAQPYTLTINEAGGGSGAVTSSPSGINCPGDCSEAFSAGKRVTLRAKPGSDAYFVGWSGGGCSGTKTCRVTMDSDKSVTATFEKKTPKLSVSPNQLDFGEVEVGKPAKQILAISNIGTADLHAAIEVTGDFFSIKGKDNLTIKPGKNYNLTVIFQPEPGYPEIIIDERTADLIPDGPILVERSKAIRAQGKIRISSENEGMDISMDGTYSAPEEVLTYNFSPKFIREYEQTDEHKHSYSNRNLEGLVILTFLGTVKTSTGEEAYYYGEGECTLDIDDYDHYFSKDQIVTEKGTLFLDAQMGARRTRNSIIIDVVKISGTGTTEICESDKNGKSCRSNDDAAYYYVYENNGGDNLKCDVRDGAVAIEGGDCIDISGLKLCNKFILHILQL
jgi:hypothetical protein